MISDDEIDEFDNYESGPFCPHYTEPGDGCAEMCRCGHPCQEHLYLVQGGDCFHDSCACTRFTEDPSGPPPPSGGKVGP